MDERQVRLSRVSAIWSIERKEAAERFRCQLRKLGYRYAVLWFESSYANLHYAGPSWSDRKDACGFYKSLRSAHRAFYRLLAREQATVISDPGTPLDAFYQREWDDGSDYGDEHGHIVLADLDNEECLAKIVSCLS